VCRIYYALVHGNTKCEGACNSDRKYSPWVLRLDIARKGAVIAPAQRQTPIEKSRDLSLQREEVWKDTNSEEWMASFLASYWELVFVSCHTPP
jgi:hypothetical protein